ncbi:hypothetical protein [Runella sp.]|uniref:hypothetical protein n=1 Tax=Runella sp. TaxID=1960881 RepID=UPI003D0D0B08
MRKFTRSDTPDVLLESDAKTGKARWQMYGERYIQNRGNNPSFEFQWPQISGKKLNQHLLPDLIAMTDDHCSYCDGFPLKRGDDTIDHFHPKTNPAFYSEVCKWENLYISCKHCQDSKVDQFEEELLRPDDIEFHFNRYFIYDYIEHTISPNPLASVEEQYRAERTIEIFDLKHKSLCISRRHAYQRYNSDADPVLSDYNFRFMFE